MWKRILGMFAGSATREGGAIDQAMQLIAERTEDIDKRNAGILEVVKLQLHAEQNPVWLPALAQWQQLTGSARAAICVLIWSSAAHKLGRMVMWGVIVVVAIPHVVTGDISLEEFAALCAGPGLYTMLKGKGR